MASPRSAAARRRPAEVAGSVAAIDLERLDEYAGLFASVEDAAALLDVDAEVLQRLIDAADGDCARVWRRGRARARIELRRTQFAQAGRNATLAVYLGKEILGQDGGGSPGPVTFIVDTGIRRDGDGED